MCSFSKHSNDSFENVDVTREENDAADTKYVSTCTQTDESFFVTNDAPMNEYSDLSGFLMMNGRNLIMKNMTGKEEITVTLIRMKSKVKVLRISTY